MRVKETIFRSNPRVRWVNYSEHQHVVTALAGYREVNGFAVSVGSAGSPPRNVPSVCPPKELSNKTSLFSDCGTLWMDPEKRIEVSHPFLVRVFLL